MFYSLKIHITHLIKYIAVKWKWGRFVKFPFSADISPKSSFEGMSKIHKHTSFRGHLGLGSYIGPECSINANIGRFCSIAWNVKTLSGTHPMTTPYATTSPNFYSLNPDNYWQSGNTFATKQLFSEDLYIDKENKISVEIGNDVWIGDRALLVGGIKISDGAVILAGAVVTKDVPPYAIVGGIPAKIIKYRFDKPTINWFLEKKWWNMSVDWFRQNWMLLCDIEKLKNNI